MQGHSVELKYRSPRINTFPHVGKRSYTRTILPAGMCLSPLHPKKDINDDSWLYSMDMLGVDEPIRY